MGSTEGMMDARRALVFVACLLLLGCRSARQKGGGVGPASLTTSSLIEEKPTAIAQASSAPPPEPAAQPFIDTVEPSSEKYSELTSRWGGGELVDLGPAASVAATPLGAVFVTRDDRLLLAPRKGSSGFVPLSLGAEAFSKYGWGPSISATHAYFSSQTGQLMRASLRTLETESLFDHARRSSRTSVQTAAGRDVVAFIAEIDARSFAYLWVSPKSEGPELIDASADGHEATSVTLVQGTPHPRLIVLEGRTSMSPVHSRIVRVTPRRVLLEPNEVVWIGPGSHELTEIHALAADRNETIAFLPTQKDFHAFGLAQLHISADGGESAEPGWQVYPNGLDPAPVAAARFCNANYVIFARPSEKRPHSPQELHIAKLHSAVPQEGDVLVRSRAFNDVSIAPTKDGAILVWTADKRTWGMVLGCPTSG